MLETEEAEVAEERNSRKAPLSDDEAGALIREVDRAWIAKGKKVRGAEAEDLTLDDLRGPTGNYRAPIVRIGKRLLVGFHPDSLRAMLNAATS